MKRSVVLIVLGTVAVGWSQGLLRPALVPRHSECKVPMCENDCWGSCADWRYKPKYGYIESIEKARAGDAEAKFCFASYCSRGEDESGVKIPRDAKKAGRLLMESAAAGFGPAEYAMVGMMTISDGYMDRIGISPWWFQDESGKRELGMYLGWWHNYTEVTNLLAKTMPYLKRAQKHGVPLTENYFKRLELMARGHDQRERKVALNAELSEAAQKGDTRLIESAKAKLAALAAEMERDKQVLLKMDAEERQAQEEVWKARAKAEEAEREAKRKSEQEEQLRGAGVDKPFVPFNVLEKMPYEECLNNAKENSAKAYYWLAFYFGKGEEVEEDESAAYKFLAKSAEMKYPAACYTVAQLHELWSLENEHGRIVWNEKVGEGFRGVKMRWNVPELKNGCLTNAVATAFVLNFYREALRGGLTYATNDITRLETNIAACKERIAKVKEEARAKRDKAQMALGLLADEKAEAKESETAAAEETERQRRAQLEQQRLAQQGQRRVRADLAQQEQQRRAQLEQRRAQLEQRRAQQEYWEGWPRRVSNGSSNYVAAVKAIEEQFKVALVDMNKKSKWKAGEGRSCIKSCADDGFYYEKYDADGRLLLVSGDRADFEELKAFDEKHDAVLREEREAWAAAKGISYDEAMSRSNEWQNVGILGRRRLGGDLRRPVAIGTERSSGGLLGGSLRSQRLLRQRAVQSAAAMQQKEIVAKEAERQAQIEPERAQREAERAQQRLQLLDLQEELRRARERDAVKTEGLESKRGL